MAQKPSERPLWFWLLASLLAPIAIFSLIGGSFLFFFYSSDTGTEKRKVTETKPELGSKAEHTKPSPRTVVKTKPRAGAVTPARTGLYDKNWDDIGREELAAEIREAGKRFRRERVALEEQQRKEDEAWKRGEIPTDEELRERLIRTKARLRVARQELEDSKRRVELQQYLTDLYTPPK